MGVLAALVRGYRYLANDGYDTVLHEQMEEQTGRIEDVDLRKEWKQVVIEYGANRVNPNTLNDKMKGIFMQCVTVFSEQSGTSHDRSKSYTETHRSRGRIVTDWEGDE